MDRSITASAVRKLTLAPLLAAVMLIYLYAVQPGIFGSVRMLFQQLLFLSLFPLLAYPVQPLIPAFRNKGRDGQRHLAMIFAFVGYLLTCILNVYADASKELCLIGWVYLLSGITILTLNCLCKLRVSGHTAGVGAVMSLSIALGHPNALIVSFPLLYLVCWASITTKRHTIPQLIGGTLVPTALTVLLTSIR